MLSFLLRDTFLLRQKQIKKLDFTDEFIVLEECIIDECMIVHTDKENTTKNLETKHKKNDLKRLEDINHVFVVNDLSHFIITETKLSV